MKYLSSLLIIFTLSGCASTFHGAKTDASRNFEAAKQSWNNSHETRKAIAGHTREIIKQGGQAIGKGLSYAGEKLEQISQ